MCVICEIACTYMVLTVLVGVLVIVLLCLCEYNMLLDTTSENIHSLRVLDARYFSPNFLILVHLVQTAHVSSF